MLGSHENIDNSVERHTNTREYQRDGVQIYADIREKGAGKYKVHITDLSRTGFRIYTASKLNVAGEIYMTLPGYAPLEAKIAWHHGQEYGCQFLENLNEATYEHIVMTHPTLAKKAA